MPKFAELSLVANAVAFALAAAAVWFAGTRISEYADAIGERTGIGHAALGVLLLGGITSLPEAAVTVTAAHSGNAGLAVNNLLGGIAMQVAILAVADMAIGRSALTAVVPDPIVLLQGNLNILLLSVVTAAIVVGDTAILGIGVWLWLLLVLYIGGVRLLAVSEGDLPWRIVGQARSEPRNGGRSPTKTTRKREELSSLVMKTAGAGSIIVVAGYVLSNTGEVIADKSGLGSSFVGAVLLAISTSLPEVSTVLAAVRLGNYTMAISDIFGTNLFDVTLLFLVVLWMPVILSSTGWVAFHALLPSLAS
jgi:cation:H+ antiporter